MSKESQTDTPKETLDGLKLPIGGRLVKVEDVTSALSGLSPEIFLRTLRSIIQGVGSDGLKLLVDGLDIQMTPSAFEDGEKVKKLEETAAGYPFSKWLSEMDCPTSQATRESLCNWWESFMLMAKENGYTPGQIDRISAVSNLWKATGPLALKMMRDPVKYRFLPALLANHPQEVARVLSELNDPEAFLELLTGERMEDMRQSPAFLGAFSTVKQRESEEVSREVRDAIYSVMLVLQRKE